MTSKHKRFNSDILTNRPKYNGLESVIGLKQINSSLFADEMISNKVSATINLFNDQFISVDRKLKKNSSMENIKKYNSSEINRILSKPKKIQKVILINKNSNQEKFLSSVKTIIGETIDRDKSPIYLKCLNDNFKLSSKKNNKLVIYNNDTYNNPIQETNNLIKGVLRSKNNLYDLKNKLKSSQKNIKITIKDTKDKKQTRVSFHDKPRKYSTSFIVKKFHDVLINALIYLYFNNVTIKEFYYNNPFQTKPFSREKSHEFFDSIKLNNIANVVKYLSQDKLLLFDYDYFGQTCFHWAAKRNFYSLIKELFRYGRNFNLYDNLKRTPLYLAAKNGHYEICKLLLENEANPFYADKLKKRPIDIVTDHNCKQILMEYYDRLSIFNTKSFFRQNVQRYHYNKKALLSN